MRDHDRETQKDGAQGQPPQKAKTGGEPDRTHKHADGHAAARPEILRDERMSHPANAEPRADLLKHLQHSHGNAYVQRVVGEAGVEKTYVPNTAAESHAQPLDAGVQSQMESAFGESFGDVRVHAGKHAGDAAGELDARAFTRGRDIYFREGEYNPSTREGQELLAHELTHVVQQRGGSATRGASVGPAGDTFEQEADEVAASVMRGERAHVEQRSAAADVQRQQKAQPQTITVSTGLMLLPNQNRRQNFAEFSVELYYGGVRGSMVETLHIAVPAGVSVAVVDLTAGMDVQVQDPGGQAARVVVIRIKVQVGVRQLQVTYSKGNRVEIAYYELITHDAKSLKAHKEQAAG